MTETVERREFLVPGPAQALGALLDVPVPDVDNGAALPLLWHWVYLLDRPAQAGLGPDGHPARDTLPVPAGHRRMWAGGRVHLYADLCCGDYATRRTKVLSVEQKHGRSGPLTFVVVGHQVEQRGQVILDEEQDLVYRPVTPGQPAGAEPAATIPAAPHEWAVDLSPVLLFRFSALTYNAHRIHYDRDYARDVEGYPGLLTHGPLQAIAMAEKARADGFPANVSFTYRLISPLFDHRGMVVSSTSDQQEVVTGVRDVHGRQTATGTLRRLG
ncbi:FAS1-like dehydratase domain-containing protein [Kibdelosporangium phytohabitans]|uniref:Mesaconyl-C4 CoA hydratase n=1 Tax=Kibdelosporangium phytohabitans TaxID=860235 RepID=A0A0N7F3W9_9PSEU|nr:MaoC family dehydratase N-terminal domain-containing protein [Kibdelosporangium phytohabitans]ALG09799.1 mesaconyl-C4 CoA hydratase [Kibdelosporangium phytohabitans]MBE1468818.1 3-methylfumaryl-CoA hydratase [Kibdelosporangium phytohabitans]